MNLRPATMDDARLLRIWREQPELTVETHLAWLREIICAKDRHVFMAECTEWLVGTGRIERLERTAWLSWTIAPSMRGRGLGRQLGELLVAHARDLGYETVGAKVRVDNVPSMKIAHQLSLNCLWLLP